jgi:signal transduction histidine kinase
LAEHPSLAVHGKRWGLAVVLASLVALLCAAAGLATPEHQSYRAAIMIGWSGGVLLLLASGALFYSSWRRTRQPREGWLTALVVTTGAYGFGLVVQAYLHPSDQLFRRGETADIVMATLILLILRRLRRDTSGPRRMVLVLLCLVAVFLPQLGALAADLDTAGGLSRITVVSLLVVLIGAGCGHAFGRVPGLREVSRHQLAAATGLYAASWLLTAQNSSSTPDIASLFALGCYLLAASTYAVEAAHLSFEWRRAGELSGDRWAREQSENDQADRLHELRASFAGVASAVRLLTMSDEPAAAAWRAGLAHNVESEIARLERLLSRQPSEPSTRSLDEVIEPVISIRRLSGQKVAWQRSGALVRCAPDPVAEALNILLVNAGNHARGSQVVVAVEPSPEQSNQVRLRVSDDGPGIPPDLRTRLFARGVRRPGSQGSGLGLQIAKRLVDSQGGTLRLDAAGRIHGTAFEITLPAATNAEVFP